ncbi:ABC transporter ATP-binding protein/permease [Pelotomaculum terephthalicicum JT]|uniref:ABC transporter ATP-binding protein n=1 Tax=Pelotomaculum terephthalicicum TaxID=206393 RepID=UPI001F04CB14|nr:ABC transporter ATP-binding protein [Pelotomaculum terephthalicicum]MCG9969142.1 ABC transporter ATP-binding protein/permease [Pelotomaculum terephthalicicum JT]
MRLLLRNILSFFGENKGYTVLYSLGVVIIVILECILPLVLKIVVDYIIIPKDYRLFSLLILGFVVTVFLYASSMLLMNVLYAKLYANVFLNYNNRLFNKIQQLSMSYFFKTRPGQILSHFTSDLESIETLYKIAIPACIFAVLKIIVNTVIAFALDWRLAVLSLIGLAATLLGPYPLDKKASPVNNALKSSKSQILSLGEESISAQLVVKSFNMQKIMRDIFLKKARERAKYDSQAFRISDMIQNSRLIFFTIFGLALLAAGSYLAMRDSITVGTVIAFFSLFSAFGTSIGYLAANLRVLSDSSVSVRRIEDFMDTDPAVCDAEDAVEVAAFNTRIAFKDVVFGYQEHEPTLKNIDLFIPKGSLVAFVGPSGSGKSSILNLLLRFYDVQKGSITIDGRDVRSIKQHSLHRLINIVLQENFLFNTTILENLRHANPEASMEEIVAAAKAAEIHDFISGLQDGYHTMVGERGSGLSGGQRQRIALARAPCSAGRPSCSWMKPPRPWTPGPKRRSIKPCCI